MTTHSHVSRRWTAAVAIIVLLPAFILFIMWSSIGLRSSALSDTDKIDYYLAYFPQWLQSMKVIHTISVISCVAAIILAARSFKKRLLSIRVLMLMTCLVAIFILLFDIFQMI